jgi:tRNA A37 threonylcarbamoyladenosine biosynthesis protein TsaE
MSFISSNFALTSGQQTALTRLKTVLDDPAPDNPVLSISGPAGSGKTTMLRYTSAALGDHVAVVVPDYAMHDQNRWLYTVMSRASKKLLIAHGWQ